MASPPRGSFSYKALDSTALSDLVARQRSGSVMRGARFDSWDTRRAFDLTATSLVMLGCLNARSDYRQRYAATRRQKSLLFVWPAHWENWRTLAKSIDSNMHHMATSRRAQRTRKALFSSKLVGCSLPVVPEVYRWAGPMLRGHGLEGPQKSSFCFKIPVRVELNSKLDAF
jgi:hypothetical protein